MRVQARDRCPPRGLAQTKGTATKESARIVATLQGCLEVGKSEVKHGCCDRVRAHSRRRNE